MHEVIKRLRLAGYERQSLNDPAHVIESVLGEGDWQVVVVKEDSIERFDVSDSDVVETGRDIGKAVEYVDGHTQPIGFHDQYGELNDPLPDLSDHNARAVFFAESSGDSPPQLTEAEAVEALGFFGSEAFVPDVAAEAITDAFGIDIDADYLRDDPDVSGGQMVRSSLLARLIAANLATVSVEDADSNITGHKKRRRQVFYRNLENIRDAYGVEA